MPIRFYPRSVSQGIRRCGEAGTITHLFQVGLGYSTFPVSAFSFQHDPAKCQIARNHLGFRPRQYKFCTDPKLGYAMLSVLRAARAVGFHCPEAFSDRRWNCSSITKLPWVSPELKLGELRIQTEA
ncbi:unnamed protein product [Dibothriocephalus latus]|uniref:Protein Wnt n=1 Tax=Dibothriocephalus latus TaxID=60516 RepID=A0A3P7P2S4_DIBLA|nr:unnamed protein product [Dibothriocephalus latus]